MPQLLLTPTFLSASASDSTGLNEALLLLERRLAAWSRDPVTFHALLQQVLGRPPSTSAESAALLTTISGSGLDINLQVLDDTTVDGLIAAYTSAAPDGGERIYINTTWLELATPEQIEAVLLEEIGHAIDHRLNGSSDSAGDEGAIFSALLRHQTPDPAARQENDQRILSIDGVAIAVEASIDTTRPSGSLVLSKDPAYVREGGDTPFGIPDTGIYTNLTFGDIDNDGDLDLFIGGSRYGYTLFFRNTGTGNIPAYTQQEGKWPLGISSVDRESSPTLADIDDDGDLDLLIGAEIDDYHGVNTDGNIFFFRNTGTASIPAYKHGPKSPSE